MSDTENHEATGQADSTGQSQQAPRTTTLYNPTIVAILYLLSFAVPFTSLVGVVLAYVWRSEDRTLDWELTHYAYLIRTFWIGLVLVVVPIIFMFAGFLAAVPHHGASQAAPVGFLVTAVLVMLLWLAAAAWFVARCVLSLIRAGRQEPMPRPTSWLF